MVYYFLLNISFQTLSFPREMGYKGSSEQDSLPTDNVKKQSWPRGADSLAATWAFTLSLHSLLYLPVAILQHGGLVFLSMYILVLVVLGTPILMVEMFLGQYSGLAVSRLYRHLCPVLSGVGVALALQSAVRAVLDMSVAMWAGKGAVTLFYEQKIGQEFFYSDMLHMNGTTLESIGTLDTKVTLALGAVSLCTFVLLAAGARSIGKVCLLMLPVCFGLLITLCIRTCMDPEGPQGFLTLINPQWSALSQATAWLEAASHVILSLQLGTGVISTYGGYSKFNHNIIRDCWVIIIGHIFWVLLSTFLIFSLFGVAYKEDTINLRNLSPDHPLISITGEGVWLGAITLVESSFTELSYGWLWAGLFFILLMILSITSIFGYVEVISNTLISPKASWLRFKPLLSLVTMLAIFLSCLVLATEGGIHIYYLLQTYIASWPLLLFTIITILSAAFSHGTSYIVKDISYMCKTTLSHISSSHFSVIITTITPLLISVSIISILTSLPSSKSSDQSWLDTLLSSHGKQ